MRPPADDEPKPPSGEATALIKGVAVLDALAAEPSGLGLAEAARASGLPKATVHRLLATLTDLGLARQLGEGRYGLGSRCLALGDAFLHGLDLRAEALAQMRWLVDATGETCHLGVLSDGQIVYIEKLDSPHPIRMHSRVGATNPAATTGLGRAILAFAPDGLVEDVLARGIPARTPATVTDPEQARRRLEDVRRDGFAIDDVENEAAIRCVAAPILDHRAAPVAGISVSGPENRVTPERAAELGPQVRRAAEEVSRALGYAGPFPPPLH
ncbi:MAG TPA: IclR family transcriptional regulator [Capillimicrobium sp.]